MAALEPWAIALIVVGGSVFLLYAVKVLLTFWAEKEYVRIKNSTKTACDVDEFVGPKNPVSAVKVVLGHKFQLGSRQASTDPIPLELIDSLHVPVRMY